MNLAMVLAGASALLLSACGESPAPEQKAEAAKPVAAAETGGRPEPRSAFEAVDTDRDGVLTRAENSAATDAMFAAMDANKDSNVTAVEMDAAAAGLAAARTISSADKIAGADRNKDRILSSAEHMSGAAATFTRMDTDRNGSLNEAEFNAGHEILRGR